MFDERRQMNVKGIDKSYPLEPLDSNKPKKQITPSKHGNSVKNRKTVAVRRVARADINSNVNDGKPLISYHAEISREGFGQDYRKDDGEEFVNENEVARYINGNHTNGNRNEVRDVSFLQSYTDTLLLDIGIINR